MQKVPPTKVKTKGVHIIGEQDEKIKEIAEGVMENALKKFAGGLNQTIEAIMTGIDGIERRVAILEEIKQLIPPKIEVTVKTEMPKELAGLIKGLQNQEE